MRIGFLGIQCDNPNLGVSALAYAGVNLVHRLVPTAAEFVLFSENSTTGIERMRRDLLLGDRRVRAVPFRHRSPGRMRTTFKEMQACDMVIDFTGGDSFSDIYGMGRLAKLLLHKEMVIRAGTSLVLAPQTYGPFSSRILLPWVRRVLRRAALVFSRDQVSIDYLRQLTAREVVLTTDVATTLPWQEAGSARPLEGAPRVGFNVSGLLWRGGYTGDNQFNLATDYRQYCRDVVGALLDSGVCVELVAHVLPNGRVDGEGELAACRSLLEEFPEARLAPEFSTPVEAKTWISRLDAFVGARMHATIAAFTSGVPTVPVAYSRKFAGLYGSLGYDVLVDLVALSTEEAVARTLRHVKERGALKSEVLAGKVAAEQLMADFSERLRPLVDAIDGSRASS